jgi:hypothetical protein
MSTSKDSGNYLVACTLVKVIHAEGKNLGTYFDLGCGTKAGPEYRCGRGFGTPAGEPLRIAADCHSLRNTRKQAAAGSQVLVWGESRST